MLGIEKLKLLLVLLKSVIVTISCQYYPAPHVATLMRRPNSEDFGIADQEILLSCLCFFGERSGGEKRVNYRAQLPC